VSSPVIAKIDAEASARRTRMVGDGGDLDVAELLERKIRQIGHRHVGCVAEATDERRRQRQERRKPHVPGRLESFDRICAARVNACLISLRNSLSSQGLEKNR
jgi:hypothetical protein